MTLMINPIESIATLYTDVLEVCKQLGDIFIS